MKALVRPKFLAVDFFCGAGGATHGLIKAGGFVIAGLDNDLSCATTYVANNRNRTGDKRPPQFLPYDLFAKTKPHQGGQQALALQALRKSLYEAKRSYPDTPLLFSICAPCQPFTRLSKQEMTAPRYRKRIRDRSLLLQCLTFIRDLRPDFVFSENVAGIASTQYGGVWRRFQKELGDLGFITGADVVNAVDFGIPQNRKRSVLLAWRKRRRVSATSQSATIDVIVVPTKDRAAKIKSVRQAIGGLPRIRAGETHELLPNHACRALSSLSRKRLASAIPGRSNALLRDSKFGDLSLKCHQRVNRRWKTRCFNDVYTRMHPDRPAPTITTRCLSVSNGRFGHYDQSQIRGISMREAAILQTFPVSYVFYPLNQLEPVARMIGNAVPPRLAQFFAKYLVSLPSRASRESAMGYGPVSSLKRSGVRRAKP